MSEFSAAAGVPANNNSNNKVVSMPWQPCNTGIIILHFIDEDLRLRKFRLCPPRSQLVSNRGGIETQICLDSKAWCISYLPLYNKLPKI